MSPLSLTNLQVSVGGQNVLNSTLNMTYENFLEQVNLAEQLTSSDFGVSTGLISQGYWEASKWYFVNVERGNIADKLQPRNINVSFTNNSNVAIDVIDECIVVYDRNKIESNPCIFQGNDKVKEHVIKGEGISGNPQRHYALTKITNSNTYYTI
jgi:hypothetical protein